MRHPIQIDTWQPESLLLEQRKLRDRLSKLVTSLPERLKRATFEVLLFLDNPDEVMHIGLLALLDLLEGQRADAGYMPAPGHPFRPHIDVRRPDEGTPTFVGSTWDSNHPIMQAVWSVPGPLVVPELSQSRELFSWRDRFLELKTRSMSIFRLAYRGRTIGMSCVERTSDHRDWHTYAIQDGHWFCDNVLSEVLFYSAKFHRALENANGPRLTDAEALAAYLASLGLSDKEIANHLGKSKRTIENQLRAAREKLNVNNRTALGHKLSQLNYSFQNSSIHGGLTIQTKTGYSLSHPSEDPISSLCLPSAHRIN